MTEIKLALTIILIPQLDFFISGQKPVPDLEEENLEETEKQFNIQSLPAHLQLLLSLLQVEKFIHQSLTEACVDIERLRKGILKSISYCLFFNRH